MAEASQNGLEPAVEEISTTCLGLRARMLDRVISGVFDRHLRPLDLRITQLTLLTAVAKAGEAGPADLARWLAMEKSTVSRTVDRLLERGWLSTTQADDGRSYRLKITRNGKTKLLAAHEHWRAAQQEVEALLSESGAEQLRALAGAVGADWVSS